MKPRIKFRPQARLASGLPAPVDTGPASAIAMAGPLVRDIARKIAPPELLTDTIQEGYRILVEIAPHYDVGRGVLFSTFVGQHVRWGLLTYLQGARTDQQRLSRPENIDESIIDLRAGPAMVVANSSRRSEVFAALRQLPKKERRAIIMRYYRNAPVVDIGERLGTSLSGAYRILERARDRLYPLLRDLTA